MTAHTVPRLSPLLVLCALTLGACSLTEEPLAPGTFELSVTGDTRAEVRGAAFVAPADSGLNVIDHVWTVWIPVVLESDQVTALPNGERRTALYINVIEPTEPNGPFVELPEGTFELAGLERVDRSRPTFSATAATPDNDVSAQRGTLRLIRTPTGVEGTLQARYSRRGFDGVVTEGDIDARFHAVTSAALAGVQTRSRRR